MANGKLTQCDMILKYMRDNGSITPLEAMGEFGCMRLAPRISDLRRKGFKISAEYVVVKNRYGGKACIKRYSLVGECDDNSTV